KDSGKTIFFSTHILSDAEALCDRVAIIHKGDLRGIGVVNDLRSTVAGKSEVIWEGAHAAVTARDLLTDIHIRADTVPGTVKSSALDLFLKTLGQQHARLFSVPPLRGTREYYFLSKKKEEEPVSS